MPSITPNSQSNPHGDGSRTPGTTALPSAMRALVQSTRAACDGAHERVGPADEPVVRVHRVANDTARQIGAQLWARTGSPTQAALRGALTRELPHYYVPNVLEPVDSYLADVIGAGSRLFLQSACTGVGSSTLALDYTRAFNADAEARGARERVCYVRIEPETTSVTKFYDTVCLALGAPLTNQEIRHRSSAYFALRVLAAALAKGACAIVFDHVRELSPRVRKCIASMLRVTDPNYAAGADHHAFAALHGRIGVCIVDQVPPEVLFRGSPDVLLLLQNRHHVLYPYRELDDVADAIRQADIGLDDLDMSDPEDAEIVSEVREQTSGLPAQMTPLLQLIDKVARLSGGIRPTPRVVNTALPFYRNLVDILSVDASSPEDQTPNYLYGVYPADVVRLPEKLNRTQRQKLHALGAGDTARHGTHTADDEDEPNGKPRADATAAMRKGRSAMLKERRAARDVAASEAAAMLRKGHVNIDYGDGDVP